MQNIRTFIAFEVGSDVKARAADLIKRLKPVAPEVRWTPPEQMHITLKFLGDVPNVEVPDVCRHVAAAVADMEPFEIDFIGAGAYPHNDNPKTLWIGVGPGEGFDQLAALNEAIESRLHSELGFARERRRFSPHLTIGRVNSTAQDTTQLSELLLQHQNFQASNAEIDEVLIYASYKQHGGPTYNVLGRAELKEEKKSRRGEE